MAFNKTQSQPSFNGQQRTGGTDKARWQANGWINFSLPAKDGGAPRKVGALPLKLSNAGEADLFNWLNADGDEAKQKKRAELFASKLIVQFRLAERDEGRAFDLPEDEEADAPAPAAPTTEAPEGARKARRQAGEAPAQG